MDIEWTYTRFVHIIIIIIVIIINIIISNMQGIYTYIPQTNYAPREYSVAAILLLLFMVLISLLSVLNLLYFYISTYRSMCAVPNMAVFCSSLTSWFLGKLLTNFLSDFEIFRVAPIFTGITFVFTFHMGCISTLRFLFIIIIIGYWLFSILQLLFVVIFSLLLNILSVTLSVTNVNASIGARLSGKHHFLLVYYI